MILLFFIIIALSLLLELIVMVFSKWNNNFDFLFNKFAFFLTRKKIIKITYAVIMLLYNRLFALYFIQSPHISLLINPKKAVFMRLDNKIFIKYNVYISLVFEVHNHIYIELDNKL